jgi:hypothetical protein
MERPEVGAFSSQEINRLLLCPYQDVFLQRGKASIDHFVPLLMMMNNKTALQDTFYNTFLQTQEQEA